MEDITFISYKREGGVVKLFIFSVCFFFFFLMNFKPFFFLFITEMPKKVRSSITGDSERRRRAESRRQRREKERLRREKEDPLAAEKRRRLNAEYQRRRKEIKNQIEAENRSRLAEIRKRLIAEHYRAKNLAHSKKDGDVSKWQVADLIFMFMEIINNVNFQYFYVSRALRLNIVCINAIHAAFHFI